MKSNRKKVVKKGRKKKNNLNESNVLNMTHGGFSTSPVIDTSISISGYTKYKNQIAAAFRDYLRFKPEIFTASLQDDVEKIKLSEFKVNYLYPDDNNLDLVVYFEYKINDKEFRGHIRNFCNENGDVQLRSTLYDEAPHLLANKEVSRRVFNYISKSLNNYFMPSFGLYEYEEQLIDKDFHILDKIYGHRVKLEEGERVEVKNVDIPNKEIDVLYNNGLYTVNKDNYYRFKYSFKKVDYDVI